MSVVGLGWTEGWSGGQRRGVDVSVGVTGGRGVRPLVVGTDKWEVTVSLRTKQV